MFDDDDWGDGIERNSQQPTGSAPTDQDHRGLEEVERALSVLGGRHPEVVRAEREGREAAARRSQELLTASRAARKQGRKRLAIGALALVVVSASGAFVYTRVDGARKQEARIAPAVVPYVGRGFVPASRSFMASQDSAEATVPEHKCVAVVAAPDLGDAAVSIVHGGKTETAGGSAIFCTCAEEEVKASAAGPVRILTIDDQAIGGLRAIDSLSPRPKTVLPSGEACAADAFYGWAASAGAASKAPLPAVPDPFARVGFVGVVAGAPPFTIVQPQPPDSCVVVLGRGPVSLEARDGSTLLSGQTLAWCQTKPELRVLSSADTITVLTAPARRIGGLLGLRGMAAELAAWAPDEDLPWLAQLTLRASVVPEPAAVSGPLRADQAKDVRVLSFAARLSARPAKTLELGTGNGPTYDADAKPGVFFSCVPATADAPESVCVQSGPLAWKPHASFAASAAAFGPLPPWMSALEGAKTEDAVDAELRLITLARVLVSRGFDPTVIEGITEKPQGVEVLGRGGEDSIVAVGIWPSPPWAVPYSDGHAWKLGDAEPRVIPLQGGVRLSLVAPVAPTAPEKIRRTVVFRHAKKP